MTFTVSEIHMGNSQVVTVDIKLVANRFHDNKTSGFDSYADILAVLASNSSDSCHMVHEIIEFVVHLRRIDNRM